ncbi:MAG: hypothetical protein IIW50_00160 [Alistipes sp.]|nr:hypothetical protein [Alistipes sp.]
MDYDGPNCKGGIREIKEIKEFKEKLPKLTKLTKFPKLSVLRSRTASASQWPIANSQQPVTK